MTSMSLPPRIRALVLCSLLAAAEASCARDGVDAPQRVSPGEAPLWAKTSNTLSVSSATPPFGDQGATVDVHIFGTGFTPGAKATWLLHGVADAHVHTNSTTFVSSSELVANITIARDATLACWDVQVALSSGKNGVGSECFEVTSAQILGPGTTGGDAYVFDISEQLQVVGYAGGGGTAFVYDDEGGMVNLGSSQGFALDPLGTLAGGFGSGSVPTAWVRQSGSIWTAEQLPQLPYSVGAAITAAARAADGTVLAAGRDDSSTATNSSSSGSNRPVLWRRVNGAWSQPERYSLPPGSARGAASGVNGLAQIVGTLDGQTAGVVWDSPTSPTVLDGIAYSINAAGTLIVGRRVTQNYWRPTYWWRDPVTHAWHTTGAQLPSIGGTRCNASALDVNSAGVIVGSSCNSSSKAQATVWRLTFSGPTPVLVGTPAALPGLGVKNTTTTELSAAHAVTEGAPYTVAGTVKSSGSRLAVRWILR